MSLSPFFSDDCKKHDYVLSLKKSLRFLLVPNAVKYKIAYFIKYIAPELKPTQTHLGCGYSRGVLAMY